MSEQPGGTDPDDERGEDRAELLPEERAAGSSKYPLLKMVKLSLDSLTGFSAAPLRVATFAGIGGAAIAVLFVLYTLIVRAQGHTVPGWTSTVAIVAGFSAIQLLCVGILGEYVGRMYAHMQGRPTYFIAYDSLTAAGHVSGPTDTALPAAPAVRVPAQPASASAHRGVRSAAPLGAHEQAHSGPAIDGQVALGRDDGPQAQVDDRAQLL